MLDKHSIPELDAKGLRQFAYTFSAILCVLFGGILLFIMKHSFPIWPWVVGVIFVIWGSLIPLTLRPVYKAWMKIGLIMGKITTPIILGVLFYGVLTLQ